MPFKALIPSENPRVEIVPLIDVIFLLLIFFLYSIFNLVEQKGIPISLAQSKTSTSQTDSNLIVTIDQDGNFYLDSQLTSPKMVIRKISNLNSSDAILIRADNKAPTGMTLKIVDAARSNGIERLAIQTESSSSQN